MVGGRFSSVKSLRHVWLFVTPWTAACQASLSINIWQSLLRLVSIALVMPSNHLILLSLSPPTLIIDCVCFFIKLLSDTTKRLHCHFYLLYFIKYILNILRILLMVSLAYLILIIHLIPFFLVCLTLVFSFLKKQPMV